MQGPYKNFKPYLAKVLDLFGDDSHIEMTALPRKLQLSQMGASPLDEIGERVVAAESLLFVFEHLKYARQRMNVMNLLTFQLSTELLGLSGRRKYVFSE